MTGFLVLAAGGSVLALSRVPWESSTIFTLQPGATYCTHVSFDTVTGGTITIAYSASPGDVYQYVMTQAQYADLYAGGPLTYLAAEAGPSGTFSAPLPTGGTYQVLSCHGPGYENTTQSGRHTITVDAVSPLRFYAGIVVLAVGGVVLGIALWLRTRPAKAPRPVYAPPPYVPGLGFGGPPMGPLQMSTPGGPPGYGVAVFHTLHVRLENVSPADEVVQIRVNGAPALTLPVPAGQTTEMDVHVNVAVVRGAPVRVEAVPRVRARASQDVMADAVGNASVSFRIE